MLRCDGPGTHRPVPTARRSYGCSKHSRDTLGHSDSTLRALRVVATTAGIINMVQMIITKA